jgi:hypothetical protein
MLIEAYGFVEFSEGAVIIVLEAVHVSDADVSSSQVRLLLECLVEHLLGLGGMIDMGKEFALYREGFSGGHVAHRMGLGGNRGLRLVALKVKGGLPGIRLDDDLQVVEIAEGLLCRRLGVVRVLIGFQIFREPPVSK